MASTLKNRSYRIPLKYHFIFWIGYFIFNVIRFGSLNEDYWYSLRSNLVEFPLGIIFTYYTIFFVIPTYIVKKKYIHFFAVFVISLAVFYLVKTGLIYLLVTKNVWPENKGANIFTFNHIVEVTIGLLYQVGFVCAIKLTIDWIYEKRRNDLLKEAQLRSELNFLKSQIQPHFFFNTLNNLYALTIEKSDTAPEVMLKLSEIMQYVLYEVKDPSIRLTKEINYIHSYLELEKLRYDAAVTANLTIEGNIDNTVVPPLIFLPFIENCFKHGTKNNDNIAIAIAFQMKSDMLIFKVENNFNVDNEIVTKHGIGIENVKRRLQLLYDEKFTLKTYVSENKYKVELKIPV